MATSLVNAAGAAIEGVCIPDLGPESSPPVALKTRIRFDESYHASGLGRTLPLFA